MIETTKISVRAHIERFIKYLWERNIPHFRTREIQELSRRGERLFGHRLGSTETYTRCFRTMKSEGDIIVRRMSNVRYGKFSPKDAKWILEGHTLW